MKTWTYDELEVGTEESVSLVLTPDLVSSYANLLGDINPVHVDEEFAAKSFFGRRVAHGLLVGSLVSTVIGTRLPGAGTVYVSQSFEFKRPVDVHDTITAWVRVEEKIDQHQKLRLRTWVTNQTGKTVLEGQAQVLIR